MTDVELKRMRSLLSYFRKQRKEGKEWIPKANSQLRIYCDMYGLNVVAVIEGKQELIPCNIIATKELSEEQKKLQLALDHCRSKKKIILENPPWIPSKEHDLTKWCETNGIDVTEFIDGDRNIYDVVTSIDTSNTSNTSNISNTPTTSIISKKKVTQKQFQA